ncbi:hypothetical protein Tco_0213977 [Tanacetum coccineum]
MGTLLTLTLTHGTCFADDSKNKKCGGNDYELKDNIPNNAPHFDNNNEHHNEKICKVGKFEDTSIGVYQKPLWISECYGTLPGRYQSLNSVFNFQYFKNYLIVFTGTIRRILGFGIRRIDPCTDLAETKPKIWYILKKNVSNLSGHSEALVNILFAQESMED